MNGSPLNFPWLSSGPLRAGRNLACAWRITDFAENQQFATLADRRGGAADRDWEQWLVR